MGFLNFNKSNLLCLEIKWLIQSDRLRQKDPLLITSFEIRQSHLTFTSKMNAVIHSLEKFWSECFLAWKCVSFMQKWCKWTTGFCGKWRGLEVWIDLTLLHMSCGAKGWQYCVDACVCVCVCVCVHDCGGVRRSDLRRGLFMSICLWERSRDVLSLCRSAPDALSLTHTHTHDVLTL